MIQTQWKPEKRRRREPDGQELADSLALLRLYPLPDDPMRYERDPSPQEIRERCAEIQATWTETEWASREMLASRAVNMRVVSVSREPCDAE